MEKTIMFFGKISKDWISANWIANLLVDVTANDDLVVYVHSSGGYVTEGMAIYNLFKNSVAKSKTAIIVGACQSMATVVTLAFDKVLISPLANYMVHKVSGIVDGNADQLREVAMQFDKLDTMLLGAYAKKTGKTSEELVGYFAKDTYLSPDEAVQEKFVDGIYDTDEAITALPQNFAELDFENKLNTLSKVFEKVVDSAKDEIVLPLNNDNNMFEPKIMRNALVDTGVMSANDFDAFEALYAKDKVKAEAYLKEKQEVYAAKKTVTEPVATPTVTPEEWQKQVDAKKQVFAQNFNSPEAGKTNRDAWDYKEWEEKDPQGLAKMLSENPDKVEKLAKEYADKTSPFRKNLW